MPSLKSLAPMCASSGPMPSSILCRRARIARRADQLVLVNDLIRSPLGYGLAWAGTQLLSRSWVVHTDGPLSVQGAFQLAEVAAMAERAGLQGARLQRCWPERFLLSWCRG
jgi:hypothetical protein